MNVKIDKNEVRAMMFKCGMDLNSLSKNIDIGSSYLSSILNGKRKPSPKLAKRIADTLGVEISDIFIIEVKKED